MKYPACLIRSFIFAACVSIPLAAQQPSSASAPDTQSESAEFDRNIMAETQKAFEALERFEAKRTEFEGFVFTQRLVPEQIGNMLAMKCTMANSWQFRFVDAHARFKASKKTPIDVMRYHVEAALTLPRYATDREQELRAFWSEIEANKTTMTPENLQKVTELATVCWEVFETLVTCSDNVSNLTLTQEFDQRKERLFTAVSSTLNTLIERAKSGDVDAEYEISRMYYMGSGITTDVVEALLWLRRAAEHGHTKAQYGLGLVYVLGKNVPKQSAEAMKWFRMAAAGGLADAQFSLGGMYASGTGVPIDYVEALKWYRMASEQGHANAQFHLGLAHSYGYGVPKDAGEAVKWYRMASEQGNADAQVKLGVAYADGSAGVQKNLTEAVQWWKKAAVQGNADAQYNFGMSYIYGEPEKQNGTEGFAWIIVASNSGHELAVKQRPIFERSFGSNVTLAALERSKQILNEIKGAKR